MLRCFDYTGAERWQVEAPKPTLVCQFCYRPAEAWKGSTVRRLVSRHPIFRRGARNQLREITARWGDRWGDQGFCLNGGLVVTATGDVIETAQGATIRTIRF